MGMDVAEDNICLQILNEYVEFFNNYIVKVIYKYFESEEVQKKISSYDSNRKRKYLVQHFIKTYNLLIAIILLAYGNNVMKLPDEAKIIFRSLFENILNFMYISSQDSEEKQIKLIEQFYDYAEVANDKYQKNLFKESDEKIKNTKEHKLIMNILNKLNIRDKLLNKEKKYKDKYTNKMSHWSGKSTKELIDYIRKNKSEFGLELYQKYYYDTNIYVHCNILEYIDLDGNIIQNTDNADILDLIHKSVFMFLGYADAYFILIEKNLKEICPNVYEKYESIDEKYQEFHNKNQDMKDIYI